MIEKKLEPKRRFSGFTEDWKQCKLGEVSDIKTGPFGSTLHAKDYVDVGMPIVTTEHFKQGYLPETKYGIPQVSDSDYLRLESYKLQVGDIVFSRVGSVDINALVTNQQDGWLFSGRVLRVRPQKINHSAYLHYLLETKSVRKDVLSRAVGQTMPSINTEILKTTNIIMSTSVDEQRKIAYLLEKIDKTIALNQLKLEKTKALKSAYLAEMFPAEGERVPNRRFAGFMEEWEMFRLDDVATYRRGSFPQPYGNEDWYDEEEGSPFVQVVDVGKNLRLVDNTKQKISKLAQPYSVFVEEGKILVTLQGSIGRVAITQYPSFIDRTILIFESFKLEINKGYFAYVIQLLFEKEKLKAPGGTIKTITKEALSEFVIHLPNIKEQERIGGFFKKIDSIITTHEQKLEKLKATKQACLNEMFV